MQNFVFPLSTHPKNTPKMAILESFWCLWCKIFLLVSAWFSVLYTTFLHTIFVELKTIPKK